MSLIHAHQISNSQELKPTTAFTSASKKHKADKQLQKLKNDENQCSNYKKIDHLESNYQFKYSKKVPKWWKLQIQNQAKISRHARMAAQNQQLQIANQLYTETSQLLQQDQHIYLMNANTVYRAQSDSNNSENFKTYQAYITDKIIVTEPMIEPSSGFTAVPSLAFDDAYIHFAA